jgi:26S proteasome regulatory subunit N10
MFSHLLVVPGGVSPTSALQSSPLMPDQHGMSSMGGSGGGGGDGFDYYGGIDPANDPEMAMAIRISQEEARAQEEARLKVLAGPFM